MSKTLKTRPLDVRILDVKDHKVGLEVKHKHEKGFCDLPERDTKAITERYQEMKNGTYPVSHRDSCQYHFSYVGHGVCGCLMCTDKVYRKETNRKARHSVKSNLLKETRKIQAVLDNGDNDLDAFDSPVFDAKNVASYLAP